MSTKNKKTKALVAVTAAFVLATSGGVIGMNGNTATAETTVLNGYVRYDPNKVTLTEDYAALTSYATNLSVDKEKHNYNDDSYRHNQITDFGVESHLDNGKRGLLMQSVQSGTDAKGTWIEFTDLLSGDFSMDFRVFSERTYYGVPTGTAKNDDVTPDYYNTFLDAKEVGITITSVTTGEAFTVFVRGSSLYGHTRPNARVWVDGETIQNGNNGLFGYGLQDGKQLSWDYPNNTVLKGTSFVNASQDTYQTYTTIEFDVETMCVYGVQNVMTLNKAGSSVQQSKALIRDLKNYPNVINDNGKYDYTTVKKLTDGNSFANGYTVSVEFTDVTANDTKLQTLSVGNSGDTYHEYANVADVTENSAAVTYDRYAKMIIYSLNGTDLAKSSSFTANAISDSLVTTDTWKDGTPIRGETEYKATKTGVNAEGATLSWSEKITGSFEESFIVRSDDTETIGFAKIANANGIPKQLAGMGWNDDGTIPAFDVKEVAFDFVSASDPSKTFSLYIRSSNAVWGKAAYPAARVHIPGDKIMNYDFEYGYGLASGLDCWDSYFVEGTFNANTGTKLSGFMGTYAASNEVAVKFDASEMKVYGWYNNKYVVIRDLAANSGTGVPTGLCATLSSADFENGYYVHFRFTDVCRDNFTGGDMWKYNQDGTIKTTTGANYAGKNTVSNAYVMFKNAQNLGYIGATDYSKPEPTVSDFGKIELGDENELVPVFFGLFASDAAIVGDISYANGADTGSISANEQGKYVFTPTVAGTYSFTYSVAWNGTTLERTSTAETVDEFSYVTFKNGENVLGTVRVANGVKISVAAIAPECNVTGYTFEGWKNGESLVGETLTPTSDMQLDAALLYGKITKASISLNGTIGLNFYVQLPAAAQVEDQATFSVDEQVLKTVDFNEETVSENNEYKFTLGIAAKDYKQTVTFRVANGAQKSYSIEEYMTTVLSDTSGAYDNVKEIVSATKNYCAAASNYFNATTEEVEVSEVTAEMLAEYAHVISGTLPEGVEVLGPSLVLESSTAIRLYFRGGADTQCTVDGVETTVNRKEIGANVVYYVEINNISAQDLDKSFTIAIGDMYTVTCSALSYVRSVLSMPDANAGLLTVVKALYDYNCAANTYFVK